MCDTGIPINIIRISYFSSTITNALFASIQTDSTTGKFQFERTSLHSLLSESYLPLPYQGKPSIVLATPGKEIDLALVVLVSKPPLIKLHPALHEVFSFSHQKQ